MRQNQVDIITLGCSKNLVDAERLMRRIEALGYTCVHDPEQPRGQIAVINTCGFIGDAKEESINTILRFVERKKRRQVSRIYVMGCLSERYLHELEAEIPEVDAWFGKFDYLSLLDILPPVPQTAACATQPFERTITTPAHYTYLKISEGCNRFCSYCAIPLITGRHTSRPIDELLDEVRWLVSQGVKEFNVIAQDLSSYGLDLYHEHRLPELIDRMAQIPGVEWIRLHYAYPTDFPYDLLPVMARHPNVCKYLDIAVQHCSDHMLTLMRRHITRAEQDELLARIRREVPGICLRTTLLVGHPGETPEDFEELKQWVRTQRFDRLGAFAYSDEEGTYANRHYNDDVPEEVKQQRLSDIMAIQQDIAAELSAAKVGTVQRVIIDRHEGDYYIGRTQYDSPEVDCEVLIPATDDNTNTNPIKTGRFYNVRIIRADEFDLYGTIC
ncbi:MAG: 30S ribosomal protein S12 methylthiotransferase RimO [Paludibacteraceae bacterium]|nr:30S ribosomal protein S12 methylthiotransferase RimO [Paludibacteraceae bacterium]